MKIKKCRKATLVVIGKEGSTNDGEDFIQKLWEDANSNFNEVEHLAKKNDNGNILGLWGAMSDFSRSFNPWEKEFSQGLYIAGVECNNEAQAPNGWDRWVIPAYEYLYVENENDNTFPCVIDYLKGNNIPLVGAAHEFNCPETGRRYLFFPICKL